MQSSAKSPVVFHWTGDSRRRLATGLKDLLASITQASDQQFKGQPRNFMADLVAAHERDNIMLILGAGASAERGLLTWNALLQELMLETIQARSNENAIQSRVLAWAFQLIFDPNPLVAARYLKRFYRRGSDPLEFLKQVRDRLYTGLIEPAQTGLLAEIRRLCMAPGIAHKLKGVITYNFDDLLEEELLSRGEGIAFRPIYQPGEHAHPNELPIFHVHGYLPRRKELTGANEVVFSEEFYHEQYGDVYRWSNLVQINAFAENNCLFVGSSLTDPNQRRLLEVAKKLRGDEEIHHFCLRRRYRFEEVKKELNWELQKQPGLRDAKVEAQLGERDAIQHLIRITENFEEEDAASFGIATIWVNDFADYPRVLRKLRDGDRSALPDRSDFQGQAVRSPKRQSRKRKPTARRPKRKK
jgi:hypothetical protein